LLARLRLFLCLTVFGALLACGASAWVLRPAPHAAPGAVAKVGVTVKTPRVARDLHKARTPWKTLKASLRHEEQSKRLVMCDDDDEDDDYEPDPSQSGGDDDDGDDLRLDARVEAVSAPPPREICRASAALRPRIRAARGHHDADEPPPRS
jgi:hypothetical protein